MSVTETLVGIDFGATPGFTVWPLTTEQERFLILHARNPPPVKWRALLGDTHLRAYCENGHTATIACDSLNELCEIGLIERSGIYGCVITPAGREAIR